MCLYGVTVASYSKLLVETTELYSAVKQEIFMKPLVRYAVCVVLSSRIAHAVYRRINRRLSPLLARYREPRYSFIYYRSTTADLTVFRRFLPVVAVYCRLS